MMGDYYLRQNDFFNAEKYYIRGLKKDSMMNYARLNLASLYNQQQKNTEALNVLLEAGAQILKTTGFIIILPSCMWK